ncbi:phosphatidyl serine synthase-domain-containing protein [Syncephalis fuscata]|nr:phosphatidyl serine synthase-domain-containing protein [Syncephalis fuscata]
MRTRGQRYSAQDPGDSSDASAITESAELSTRRVNRDHIFTKPFADEIDPTITFLYKPHNISLLLVTLAVFVYLALLTDDGDRVTNIKRGIVICCITFLVIGLIQFRDGPFIRPHPAVWRISLGISVLYQMFLTFILFQNKEDTRKLFAYISPELGAPLPERSYADNCELSWDNLMNQIDIFVFAHAFGWWAKAMIIRDYTFAWIMSVFFEIMEYSLQHQLPNFAECWWDHWILDVLVCNWLGIYFGMKTCQYLEMKGYRWEGIRDIPEYSGKVRRTVQQFTPHSWTKFEWGANKSFKKFSMMLVLSAIWLACEVNVFYLKYLFWIPPEHWLVTFRLAIMFAFSVPAMREYMNMHQTSKDCKRLGSHSWLQLANIATELLVIVKYSRGEFTESAPLSVILFWCFFMTSLSVYAYYQFWYRPQQEKKHVKDE